MERQAVVCESVNVVVFSLVKILSRILQKMIKKRKHRVWVKPWISRRDALGASNNLVRELEVEDWEAYRNHLRMTPELFNKLLEAVGPKIQKKDTLMRAALPAKVKLQFTLRYLATGDSFGTLCDLYRIPRSSVSKFVPEVCRAIYEALEDFIQVPQTLEEWRQVQSTFQQRWNFPNCCEALDGKRISVRNPPGAGSVYYNYKGFFSVILFAVADANYCFLYIDVGRNGRMNDAAVFANSALNSALVGNQLNFPEDGVFVGDDAFPLQKNLMKPYTRCIGLNKQKRIFNYRLSRARRVVENAFGILAARFRVFTKPITLSVECVPVLVKASCALHNWLRKTLGDKYIPPGTLDTEDHNTGDLVNGTWRVQAGPLLGLQPTATHNHARNAAQIRDRYAQYFSGPGTVS